jgi:hypothetical protein
VAEPVATDELLAAHWRHVDACETTETYAGTMDFDHRLNTPEGTILGEAVPIMDENEWAQFCADHAAVPEQFDRMSDDQWGRFIDGQARTLAELEAAQAGQLHPERAALHSRVMALSDETGLSYEDALDRVLDREERLP